MSWNNFSRTYSELASSDSAWAQMLGGWGLGGLANIWSTSAGNFPAGMSDAAEHARFNANTAQSGQKALGYVGTAISVYDSAYSSSGNTRLRQSRPRVYNTLP